MLTAGLRAVCDEMLAELGPGPARERIESLHEHLSEPLRIAVAGRVSSGKSTLVNALLGLRVAPTAAGECTRVVTWYAFGETDRAEVRFRDGRVARIALGPGRALPAELGADAADVESVRVELYVDLLEAVTLIDTPGLSSLGGSGERTEDLLGLHSQEAVAQADALIYLVAGDMRADDERILEAFQANSGAMRASLVNTVAVLNKVDKLGRDPESARAAADALIGSWGRDLHSRVSAIVPFNALLAETAEAGRLTEGHAQALERLAALPMPECERLLSSVRRFAAEQGDLPVAAAERAALLARLDLFGARLCLERARAGSTGALELTRELRAASGITALRRLLRDVFSRRAETLKADVALGELHDIVAHAPDDPATGRMSALLHDWSERLAVHPDAQALRLMALLREVGSGTLELPPDLEAELKRMAIGATVPERLGIDPAAPAADLERAALGRAGAWRAYGNDSRRNPMQVRAARLAAVAYAGLVRELRDQGAGVR